MLLAKVLEQFKANRYKEIICSLANFQIVNYASANLSGQNNFILFSFFPFKRYFKMVIIIIIIIILLLLLTTQRFQFLVMQNT